MASAPSRTSATAVAGHGEPERVFIRNGRAIPDGGTVRTVALFASGDLVAVAESDGILLHPSVVLEQ